MRVFISWSGSRGNELAKAIRIWLRKFDDRFKPVLSSEDIQAGTGWSEALRKLLAGRVGIICVTRRGIASQWVSFEAGALWRAVRDTRVIPLLFDVTPEEMVRHPLSQFQCKAADRDGLFHAVRTLDKFRTGRWSPRIEARFEHHWPRLKGMFDRINHMVLLDEIEEAAGLNLWRPPILRPVSAYLKRALEAGRKPSLDIYDINALAPFHSAFEEIRVFLSGGGRLRVLMLDPRAKVYTQRVKLEKDKVGRIANEHRACFHILADLLRQSRRKLGDGVELRLSSAPPTGALLLVDVDAGGMILSNEYPRAAGARGLAVPWYRYTALDQTLFDKYHRRFEKLWARATPVRLKRNLRPPKEWPFVP